jgi:hypothetical protein
VGCPFQVPLDHFQLRARALRVEVRRPELIGQAKPGEVARDIRDVIREVLPRKSAARFEHLTQRWVGPTDLTRSEDDQPYLAEQTTFIERPDSGPLTSEDIERVLQGKALVLERPGGKCDFILRDHHVVDAVLHRYWRTGELPRRLFHADRHSDWDGTTVWSAQAARWWRWLETIRREDGTPILPHLDVTYVTGVAKREPWMTGTDIGTAYSFPKDVPDPHWEAALSRLAQAPADWVSIDLDLLQPRPQYELMQGMLADPRFVRALADAEVRVFVLSPQFTNGGDRVPSQAIYGDVDESRRLINALRAPADHPR